MVLTRGFGAVWLSMKVAFPSDHLITGGSLSSCFHLAFSDPESDPESVVLGTAYDSLRSQLPSYLHTAYQISFGGTNVHVLVSFSQLSGLCFSLSSCLLGSRTKLSLLFIHPYLVFIVLSMSPGHQHPYIRNVH